jgi:hypothetical protein
MSGIKLASRRLLLISVMALALALAAQAAVLAVPLYIAMAALCERCGQ